MAKSSDNTKIEEHPKKSGIRIITVDNATLGKKFGFSYQVNIPIKVSGGKRIRKQFPTLDKARKWAAKQHRGAQRDGEAFFRLSAKERHEMGVAIPKLRDKGISITEAVEFALLRLRPPNGKQLLSDVIQELQESKRKRHEAGDLADSSLKDFNCRSRRLQKDMGSLIVHEIDVGHVKKWVASLEVSNHTRMNYLRIASEIFRYAKQKRYIRENPIDDLSDNDRKELHGRLIHGGEIRVLSIGQADNFINFTAVQYPEFLGLVALGLFCGIRTEELKQLTWDKVNLAESYVTIDSSIAKKSRIRHVTIPDNAKEWLTCCLNRQGKVAPVSGKRFEYQFSKLRHKAGFEDKNGKSTWPANGMRHSYGTYHYALHSDSNLTSRALGHLAGDDTLFNHYRQLAKKSDGEKFFAIKPAASAAKVVEFA